MFEFSVVVKGEVMDSFTNLIAIWTDPFQRERHGCNEFHEGIKAFRGIRSFREIRVIVTTSLEPPPIPLLVGPVDTKGDMIK